MKLSISLVAVMLGSVGVALASPVIASPLIRRDDDVGEDVAGLGRCPVSPPHQFNGH